jgi:hypothetical protein
MALQLKVLRTLTGTDGLGITIDDATGDYNASTNTTGWGSPNETRSDFGLILFVVEKASTGDVVVTPAMAAPSTPTPLTVTQWTATNNVGGWYEYYMLAAHKYDGIVTFDTGEICYSPGDDEWYKSTADANGTDPESGGGSNWTLLDKSNYVTLIEEFRTAEQIEETEDTDMLHYVPYDNRMDQIVFQVDVPINRYLVEANCECNDICELSDYTKFRIKYYAMRIQFAKKSYAVAQSMYERLYAQLI